MKTIARLLLSVIASTVVFVLAVYVFVLSLGGLPKENFHSLLQVSAAVGLIGAVFVFLPIGLISMAKGLSSPLLYLLPGALIPVLLVMYFRPFGHDDFLGMTLQTGLVAVFGGIAAFTFWLLAPRKNIS